MTHIPQRWLRYGLPEMFQLMGIMHSPWQGCYLNSKQQKINYLILCMKPQDFFRHFLPELGDSL